jgi:hypothetical protein
MAAAIPEAMTLMHGAIVMAEAVVRAAVIAGILARVLQGCHAALPLDFNCPGSAV